MQRHYNNKAYKVYKAWNVKWGKKTIVENSILSGYKIKSQNLFTRNAWMQIWNAKNLSASPKFLSSTKMPNLFCIPLNYSNLWRYK